MSILLPDAPLPPGEEPACRLQLDLPAELRVAGDAHPCRVTSLSASGVEMVLSNGPAPSAAPHAVIHIPALGLYRARRAWSDGARAAYLFELTEFSRRALDALIRDRFPT
ncbi:hypothetical protein N8I71_17235 [Roseibacterium sp. SDUM158016]|uniref:hypothetical protein n=1 Tax=Roseicyclus sediminis TaxID=2980997 RepID=UPI0021CEF40A|nr:hypothetical protein [Roseibacterium sp. SDUM158016]MCU4654586.1 hypothetical protein [Roseibacterium sp. SDUM158016]